MKNKGLKADPSKAKVEGKEHGDKDEKIGVRDKLSSPSTENSHSDLKSPITSTVKKLETIAESETTHTAESPDISQKEELKEPSTDSFPLKKEGKEKDASPSKKPRPPPLFIPRPVAQRKGTPMSASELPCLLLQPCLNLGGSWSKLRYYS